MLLAPMLVYGFCEILRLQNTQKEFLKGIAPNEHGGILFRQADGMPDFSSDFRELLTNNTLKNEKRAITVVYIYESSCAISPDEVQSLAREVKKIASDEGFFQSVLYLVWLLSDNDDNSRGRKAFFDSKSSSFAGVCLLSSKRNDMSTAGIDLRWSILPTLLRLMGQEKNLPHCFSVGCGKMQCSQAELERYVQHELVTRILSGKPLAHENPWASNGPVYLASRRLLEGENSACNYFYYDAIGKQALSSNEKIMDSKIAAEKLFDYWLQIAAAHPYPEDLDWFLSSKDAEGMYSFFDLRGSVQADLAKGGLFRCKKATAYNDFISQRKQRKLDWFAALKKASEALLPVKKREILALIETRNHLLESFKTDSSFIEAYARVFDTIQTKLNALINTTFDTAAYFSLSKQNPAPASVDHWKNYLSYYTDEIKQAWSNIRKEFGGKSGEDVAAACENGIDLEAKKLYICLSSTNYTGRVEDYYYLPDGIRAPRYKSEQKSLHVCEIHNDAYNNIEKLRIAPLDVEMGLTAFAQHNKEEKVNLPSERAYGEGISTDVAPVLAENAELVEGNASIYFAVENGQVCFSWPEGIKSESLHLDIVGKSCSEYRILKKNHLASGGRFALPEGLNGEYTLVLRAGAETLASISWVEGEPLQLKYTQKQLTLGRVTLEQHCLSTQAVESLHQEALCLNIEGKIVPLQGRVKRGKMEWILYTEPNAPLPFANNPYGERYYSFHLI